MLKIKKKESSASTNYQMGYNQPPPPQQFPPQQNQFPANNYYNQNSSHPAYGGKGSNMYSNFNVEKNYTPYGDPNIR